MTTIDSEQLTNLLKDPIIVRIVSILGIARSSILKLLEYNLSRNDINHALSSGAITVDKSVSSASFYEYDQRNMLVSGDYYFYKFLNSKMKLN